MNGQITIIGGTHSGGKNAEIWDATTQTWIINEMDENGFPKEYKNFLGSVLKNTVPIGSPIKTFLFKIRLSYRFTTCKWILYIQRFSLWKWRWHMGLRSSRWQLYRLHQQTRTTTVFIRWTNGTCLEAGLRKDWSFMFLLTLFITVNDNGCLLV